MSQDRIGEIEQRKANFYSDLGCSDEQSDITWLLEEVRVLREALISLLSGHANLYKANFGEQADPMIDCVYRDAKSALERERR